MDFPNRKPETASPESSLLAALRSGGVRRDEVAPRLSVPERICVCLMG